LSDPYFILGLTILTLRFEDVEKAPMRAIRIGYATIRPVPVVAKITYLKETGIRCGWRRGRALLAGGVHALDPAGFSGANMPR